MDISNPQGLPARSALWRCEPHEHCERPPCHKRLPRRRPPRVPRARCVSMAGLLAHPWLSTELAAPTNLRLWHCGAVASSMIFYASIKRLCAGPLSALVSSTFPTLDPFARQSETARDVERTGVSAARARTRRRGARSLDAASSFEISARFDPFRRDASGARNCSQAVGRARRVALPRVAVAVPDVSLGQRRRVFFLRRKRRLPTDGRARRRHGARPARAWR